MDREGDRAVAWVDEHPWGMDQGARGRDITPPRRGGCRCPVAVDGDRGNGFVGGGPV